LARGAAAALLLLVGWLGQMVNGHLYHIGIRLISTVARGDDDETRLGQLLAAPLSWASFALFQVAVASRARADIQLARAADRSGGRRILCVGHDGRQCHNRRAPSHQLS
jgi:hypothetical protein